MTPSDPERAIKIQVCPGCDHKNGPGEILYGLPDGPPGPRVYALGKVA